MDTAPTALSTRSTGVWETSDTIIITIDKTKTGSAAAASTTSAATVTTKALASPTTMVTTTTTTTTNQLHNGEVFAL